MVAPQYGIHKYHKNHAVRKLERNGHEKLLHYSTLTQQDMLRLENEPPPLTAEESRMKGEEYRPVFIATCRQTVN